MEGSRKELVRFIRLVVAEFQIPDERTPTAKLQDWAVNLAWGGSVSLASSGMMSIMRREGGRQIDAGMYDGGKLDERFRLFGQALQRHMRRRIVDCELQAIHTRAPAPELYWAVVASMVDDGTVNANVMRLAVCPTHERSASSSRANSQSAIRSGWRSFESGRCGSATQRRPRSVNRYPPPQPMCTLASRWRKRWTSYDTCGSADRAVLRLPTLRCGGIRRRSRRL